MTRTIVLCLTAVSFASAQLYQPAETGLPALPSNIVQPALPQEAIAIVYPTVTGHSTAVHAGGDLQAVLNGASCGDEIVLDSGTTYSGNFSIPAKNCAGWILVRSVSILSLPSGVRVSQSQASLLPTVMTMNSQSVLGFEHGTSNWYFAGINFTVEHGVQGLWNLIALDGDATSVAQLPHNIVFDRVLVHGNDQYCVRGFLANAASFVLVNSQVYDFNHNGQDTQAVLAYNSPGPFLIANNYLEATGENIMFGGGGVPTIKGVIPSDIMVVRNNLAKLSNWYHEPAPCGGAGQTQCYDIKNNFECKSCQRVLVDSNLMSYGVAQGQGECAIVNIFSGFSANDITFSNNLCQHTAQGFALNGYSAAATQRVMLRNNLFVDVSPTWGGGRCYSISGPSSNVTIDHNTCINTGPAAFLGDSPPSSNVGFSYTNNIVGGPLNADGDNPLMVVQNFSAGSSVSYDVFVGDVWPQGCVGCNPQGPAYPAANHFFEATSTATPAGDTAPCNYPAGLSAACIPLNWALVGMIDYAGGAAGTDLPGLALAPTSPYHNAGGDGSDIGANITYVLAAVREARSPRGRQPIVRPLTH